MSEPNYETALKIAISNLEYISKQKCAGRYGPCGAADTIASYAEDALEEIEQALEADNETN